MRIYILIISLLICTALISAITLFKTSQGIDFYHYWGVMKAQKWSEGKLGSPYKEPGEYAKVLNAHSDRSDDRRLKIANRFRRDLTKDVNLSQTPLLYIVCSVFPEDYSLAFGIFQSLQILMFIGSIVLLSSCFSGNRLILLTLALMMVLFYQPLLSGLRVGNVNTFQFIFIVLITVFAERYLGGRSEGKSLWPDSVFICMAALLVLLKPNMLLVGLLFVFYLWARRGTKTFMRAAGAGAIFCALIFLITVVQYDSWTIWSEWYSYVKGGDEKTLIEPVSRGNFSTVLLASEKYEKSTKNVTIIIACILAVSSIAALILSRSRDTRGLKGMWQNTVQAFRDPYLCASAGLTATLALSPLVWYHYYIISLFPAIWLLSDRHPKFISISGLLSILLTSGVVFGVGSVLFNWSSSLPYIIAAGWIPLWIGILMVVVRGQKIAN
jgi:hypothetical protein